jgi:hypothetical protein
MNLFSLLKTIRRKLQLWILQTAKPLNKLPINNKILKFLDMKIMKKIKKINYRRI